MKAFFYIVAIIVSATAAHAASIAGRETNSSTKFKLGPESRKASWALDAYDHERTVKLEFNLTADELAKAPEIEIVVYRLDSPGRPAVGREKAEIKKGDRSLSLTVKFTGHEKMKDVWAARVIVDGVAVAWAGETADALALIRPPVMPK